MNLPVRAKTHYVKNFGYICLNVLRYKNNPIIFT